MEISENEQVERNINLVKKLSTFFDERTKRQRFEMLKLIELTATSIKTSKNSNLKQIVQHALDEDIIKIEALNKMAKASDPFPFRFNKLLDLLTQAKKYIDLNWEEIKEGNAQKLLYKPNGVSWEGTSMLNYMQTSMLEILSIIYETPISDLQCLKESDGIYQIATSPNIQSISVTNNRNGNSIEKFELLHEWRWAAVRKTSSILIYKLVTPTLGYAFGGSRFESEFVDKKLRLHDCSSFVSEILNLSENFTTNSLKIFTTPEKEDEVEMQQGQESLKLVKSVLEYKGVNGLPEAGNVFLVKSHCGFVIETNSERNFIKTCEFTRYMPFSEGLVQLDCKLNENGKWAKENVTTSDELLMFVGKTNENTASLPLQPNQMYFFEVKNLIV